MVIQGKTVLVLVNPRGGSKGLPGKNVRPLLGKPLIGWSIDQERASKYVDAVVGSTDDDAIVVATRDHCAELPFMRPPELASDTATSIDVILHALNALESAGPRYDLLVLLEPTWPLREAAGIDAALEAMLAYPQARSIVSGLEMPAAPEDLMRESTEYVCKKSGLSQDEFDVLMALPTRTFLDYPSSYTRLEQAKTVMCFLRGGVGCDGGSGRVHA